MNKGKYTLSKEDAEKMIARLEAQTDPSSSVKKFIEAYRINPKVILKCTVVERKGGGTPSEEQ